MDITESKNRVCCSFIWLQIQTTGRILLSGDFIDELGNC
jgi:hypothetical protein